jgi:predicted dehydrogenase
MVNNRVASRRQFLKGVAGGAGLLILAGESAFGYEANERLNIALVGVGGRGNWFVERMPRLANIVAMCDVNDRKSEGAYKVLPDAKKFHDFRKMLDEMDKEIDAVVVATPDNTHAVATAAAMRHGKGVLCEKPLTHDVFEAREMARIAAECKVATQMGNQGTASPGFRQAVEIIQSGMLGEIKEVHVWNTNGGQGERPLPTDAHPLPDYLHYDLWLGPAKWREYNSRWVEWHTWRDFATGCLGNWASHTMNVVFKGLRLDSLWKENKQKFTLEAQVSGYHDATFPNWEIIRYDIPARGEMPAVRINWYNGNHQAPGPRKEIEEMMGRQLDWGDAGAKRWQDHAGCLLVGTKGQLHSTSHNTEYALSPKGKFTAADLPKPTLPRVRGHEEEWVDACKGGAEPMSNFGYSGPLAEFVLLGNVATRVKEKLEFDPAEMKIINSATADGLLRREYREGWKL